MKRKALILLFCVTLPLSLVARTAVAGPVPGFNSAIAASVWSTALTYIEPRALDDVTIPQMTLWGLNGLAALDPNLNATLQDNQIRLYGPNRLLVALPAPNATNASAWGQAAAKVAAVAYANSTPLQQAGTQAIISNFFDELFNHFDPYSRYEDPTQAAQDELMIVGLAGTGLTLEAQSGHVVISSVAADSPAMNAGLAAGMVVTSVGGHHVYPSMVTALNNGMAGLPDSLYTLSFIDPQADSQAIQSVSLKRSLIPLQTVFTEPSLAPGIALLKITGFNKGTGDQFAQALANLVTTTPNLKGLVIDLRGNRGGVVRQAVLVADSLMASGEIVKTHGRDPDASQDFTAEGGDLTNGAKLVVLVDGQTASAAEILSSALADDGRAVVVGSETLGKGLIQTITTLPDGGDLFVTWSRDIAPRGWPLQGLGVMPQVCTSNGPYSLSQQFSALEQGHNLMTPILTKARAQRAPVNIDTVLDIRNNCPADIGGDLDEQAAVALIQNDKMYQSALLH